MQTPCAEIDIPKWIKTQRDAQTYLGLMPVADLAVLCHNFSCNVAEVEKRFCEHAGVKYNAILS